MVTLCFLCVCLNLFYSAIYRYIVIVYFWCSCICMCGIYLGDPNDQQWGLPAGIHLLLQGFNGLYGLSIVTHKATEVSYLSVVLQHHSDIIADILNCFSLVYIYVCLIKFQHVELSRATEAVQKITSLSEGPSPICWWRSLIGQHPTFS